MKGKKNISQLTLAIVSLLYINISYFSKSQLKMKKSIKKIRVPHIENTQIKDKLIHCNAANIVFFRQ